MARGTTHAAARVRSGPTRGSSGTGGGRGCGVVRARLTTGDGVGSTGEAAASGGGRAKEGRARRSPGGKQRRDGVVGRQRRRHRECRGVAPPIWIEGGGRARGGKWGSGDRVARVRSPQGGYRRRLGRPGWPGGHLVQVGRPAGPSGPVGQGAFSPIFCCVFFSFFYSITFFIFFYFSFIKFKSDN